MIKLIEAFKIKEGYVDKNGNYVQDWEDFQFRGTATDYADYVKSVKDDWRQQKGQITKSNEPSSQKQSITKDIAAEPQANQSNLPPIKWSNFSDISTANIGGTEFDGIKKIYFDYMNKTYSADNPEANIKLWPAKISGITKIKDIENLGVVSILAHRRSAKRDDVELIIMIRFPTHRNLPVKFNIGAWRWDYKNKWFIGGFFETDKEAWKTLGFEL